MACSDLFDEIRNLDDLISSEILNLTACRCLDIASLFDEIRNLDDLISSEILNLTACRRLDIASSTLIVSAA